jgi:hypothetical protein
MTDIDLIYHCLGIIMESIAFNAGQVRMNQDNIPAPNPSNVKGE